LPRRKSCSTPARLLRRSSTRSRPRQSRRRPSSRGAAGVASSSPRRSSGFALMPLDRTRGPVNTPLGEGD
jgi:hypothetical protein